jgi:hypothetical protein
MKLPPAGEFAGGFHYIFAMGSTEGSVEFLYQSLALAVGISPMVY